MKALGGFPKRERPQSEYPVIDLQNQFFSFEDLEAEDLDPDDLRIGGKLKVNLAHIKLDEWLDEIRDDHKQLLYLLDRAKPVSPERDAKLARLREIISQHAANPPKNNDGKPVRKILVFTAFADTAKYLYQHAAGWAHRELGLHTGFVAGGGRYETTLGRPRFSDILTNFAPLAKREKTGSG